MLILPHTIQLARPQGETKDYAYSSCKAQVTPMKFGQAAGVAGVEADNPFMVIIGPSDADLVEVGGRMIFNGFTFAVMSNAALYQGIGRADHASFVVDRKGPNLDA
ncbi:MAG: hypothetical protein ACOYOL_07170 [Chthoniobacterales bacterium]